MSTIQYSDGTKIEFSGTPTQQDAEEAYNQAKGIKTQQQTTPDQTQQPGLGPKGIGSTDTSGIKSFFGNVGNALTSSEQKFGQDIAGAASAILPDSLTGADQLKHAADTHAQTIETLTKLIQDRRSKGIDTTLLQNQLKNDVQNAPPQMSDLYPSINKSALQVLGDAGGVALDALSGGALKGIKGVGLVKNIAQTAEEAQKAKEAYNALSLSQKLASIGKDTLKAAAVTAPIGYGYDVTQKAQNNQLDFTPGFGTTLGVAAPLAVGGARATKAIVSEALPVVASNLSGVSKGTYDQMKTGGVSGNIGKVDTQSVFNDARTQQSLFNKSIQEKFGSEQSKIIDQFDGVRIGMNQNEQTGLKKIATEFGFADQLPRNLNNLSAKETMDLLGEINSIDPVKEFDSPLTKKYKLALAELKDGLKSKAVDQFGGQGGIFDQVYSDYAKGKKVLRDVSSIIGKPGAKLTPVQQTTAQNRLMKVFDEDKNAYFNAIKTLEDQTGSKILDKIAAAKLSPILPKTLRGGATGVIGLASDVLGLATLPISSPRMGAWLIRKLGGYEPSTVDKLLNLSPKIRQSIYNAIYKENMSFDNAVEKFTSHISSIENKQGGFVSLGAVNNIHPEDVDLMSKFIDSVRLKGKSVAPEITDSEYSQVEKLAAKFKINMDKSLAGIANDFSKILEGKKKVVGTAVTGSIKK